jgi:hypothetical protein
MRLSECGNISVSVDLLPQNLVDNQITPGFMGKGGIVTGRVISCAVKMGNL